MTEENVMETDYELDEITEDTDESDAEPEAPAEPEPADAPEPMSAGEEPT